MSQHIVSPKVYILIFAALLALTALTTGAAFIDLGAFNTVVALMIAVTKAILVILFFMHLRYSPHLTRIVVVAGFFWLAILISLTLSDFRTRRWTPSPSGWETSAISRQLTVDSKPRIPFARRALAENTPQTTVHSRQ